MASGYSECSATGGHGRHGQIRTADLSLRRRPLYPSELRARNLFIVALQAFSADIRAIVHAVEMDEARGSISTVDGRGQVGSGGSDTEHAATRRFESRRPLARARVEDCGSRSFSALDSIDGLAGNKGAGIAGGGQHYANRRAG